MSVYSPHLLLISLQSLSSNTIQISSFTPCDTSPTSLLILFQNTNLLKRFQNLSLNASTALIMTSRTTSTVLASTMYFLKSTYANRLAEVNVSCDGGGTDIVPIWIIGSEFLEGGGLDNIDPGGDFDFTYPLELIHMFESSTGSF